MRHTFDHLESMSDDNKSDFKIGNICKVMNELPYPNPTTPTPLKKIKQQFIQHFQRNFTGKQENSQIQKF